MSIPSFLPKLVDVAAREIFEPRFPNIPTEIDHWMRIIDDSISTKLFDSSTLQTTSSIVDVQAVQAHNVDVSATASSSVSTKSSDGSTANSMPGPSIDPRRDFDIVGKHLLERVDVRTPI